MLSSKILDDLARKSGVTPPDTIDGISLFVKRVLKTNAAKLNTFSKEARDYLHDAIKAVKTNQPVPLPKDIDTTSGGEITEQEIPEDFQSVLDEMLPDTMTSHNNFVPQSLSSLLEMMNNGVIRVPYFQREFIWKPKVQEAFIESFLSGVPVHSIFFCIDPNRLERKHLVDGCQRLTTLKLFREGATKFKGRRFSDFPVSVQHKFLYTILPTTECLTDPKNWPRIFRRINLTSRPLNDIEMRRVAYDHKLMDDLNIIAKKNEHWKNTFGKNTRFKGLHALLRALAMHHSYQEYQKPLTTFLDTFCENVVDEKISIDRVQLQVDLDNAIMALSDRIGKQSFRLTKQVHLGMVDMMVHGTLLAKESEPGIGIERLGTIMESARKEVISDPVVVNCLMKNAAEPDHVIERMRRMTAAVEHRIK